MEPRSYGCLAPARPRPALAGLAAVLALAGCDHRDEGGQGPSGPAADETEAPADEATEDGIASSAAYAERRTERFDYVFRPGEPMKPAHRERLTWPAQKADQYDDVRWQNPQRYAITAQAPDHVRGMVEWEPMKAIVLSYPGYMSDYDNATHTMVQIGVHAAEVAEVWYVVDATQTRNFLEEELTSAGMSEETLSSKVRFIQLPIDSVWVIDSGPLPLVDEEADSFAFADFRYYHNRPNDDGLPTVLGRALPELGAEQPTVTYRMPLNTEGGTYQTTTDGVCFTGNRQLFHMSCSDGECNQDLRDMPLDEVQDHALTKEVEEVWGEYAGCEDVVVTNSITDDGTGHIDMYMKVVDDETILLGEYTEPFANEAQERNAERMDANAAFLEAYVKPNGGQFEVKRMVMPGHRSTNDGSVPFTYLNSTFINGLNLWPAYTFEEWEDSRAQAEEKWESAMPEWDHVWIDSEELSFWSGAIHCVTRTIPERKPGLWVADGSCEGGTCQSPEGGYGGTCQPHEAEKNVCWGPEWLCQCNDCTTECDYEPGEDDDGCGNVPFEGCCADGELQYCDSGSLKTEDCDGSCGWSEDDGYYNCGEEGGDPSEEFPRSCEDLTCEPDCEGRECGPDGCGGSCGSCSQGRACNEQGQCERACRDACTETGAYGCAGNVAWQCAEGDSGCLERFETDCTVGGRVCNSGACVPAPGQAPDPDASDASGPDAGGDATSPDVPDTEDDGSAGCGAAGGGAPLPVGVLAALLVAMALRRGPVRVARR